MKELFLQNISEIISKGVKNLKGKGTMIVTIGAMTALLICVMMMQFKTIESTDIEALELMRETELRTELASWKTKYEEANQQLIDTQNKIAEYEEKIENNQEASELLEKEVEHASMILGSTDVIGNGVVITLKDNDYALIDGSDIYKLLNELRLAGAEAISVNDVRITSMTDVKSIAPGMITIGGERVISPYVVKAIGDQTYLESGLTLKNYGYMDLVLKSENKTGVLERKNDIIIYANRNEPSFRYAEEVESE